MHAWHDISPGLKSPEIVRVVIEVPKGSKNKYELDKESGLLKVDRVLFSSMHYPANYGFIPQSLCGDHDPLDVLVLGQETVVPFCLMEARPIGVMKMWDQGEEDDKIIAVHENDPEYAHFRTLEQLPSHRMREVKRFFEDYKALELKEVRVERFEGADEARKVVQASLEMYRQHKAAGLPFSS
jgi:inorganic pyrophosphatase